MKTTVVNWVTEEDKDICRVLREYYSFFKEPDLMDEDNWFAWFTPWSGGDDLSSVLDPASEEVVAILGILPDDVNYFYEGDLEGFNGIIRQMEKAAAEARELRDTAEHTVVNDGLMDALEKISK